MLKERQKMTQSCQKSYSDVSRRPLEFEVDDSVYMNVSPMKGFMRCGKKEKISLGILVLTESPRELAVSLMSWSYPKS